MYPDQFQRQLAAYQEFYMMPVQIIDVGGAEKAPV
jgi:hypothetical protein